VRSNNESKQSRLENKKILSGDPTLLFKRRTRGGGQQKTKPSDSGITKSRFQLVGNKIQKKNKSKSRKKTSASNGRKKTMSKKGVLGDFQW